MKVKEVCKIEHSVAMPGRKAEDEGTSKRLDRQEQERWTSERHHQVRQVGTGL